MIDFLSISKPVHVVTFTVLYLFLVLLTEVLLPLITVLLAPQSRSAALHVSGIFWLLWVVIIGLVICNFIEDVCAVLMGTSIWTILCPVIYALTNCTFYWHSISIRGFLPWGFVERLVLMASSHLLYLGWKGYDLDQHFCRLQTILCFCCYVTGFSFRICKVWYGFLNCSSSCIKISCWFGLTTSM